MPRGDCTGPWGLGPMSGRGAGCCAGYPVPGYMNPASRAGFGFGFGRGRGRGWGRGLGRGWGLGWGAAWHWGAGFHPYPGGAIHGPWGPWPGAPGAVSESEFLKEQAAALKDQLNQIQKRLDELEQEKEEEE